MRLCSLVLMIILPCISKGQQTPADTNFVFWSSERKLREDDFQMKISTITDRLSFAQFVTDYNIIGSFTIGLPKNYKQRIRNYFIKSASWIDTSSISGPTVNYHQVIFDLSEVYVRRFRKTIYEKRKDIIRGRVQIDHLYAKFLTELAERRAMCDTETSSGHDPEQLQKWENLIRKELEDLKEYSAD